jgi:DNA repair exonuclease SbcCD nuclease subunit
VTRILVTGDWHADAVTAGVPREDDIRKALQEILAAVRRHSCDVVLFLGDLCNPDTPRAWRASMLAVEFARELVELRASSIWLTGNHDVIEDGHGSHTLLPLKAYAAELDAVVCDEPRIVPIDGGHVLALPYVARSHGYDPAKEVEAAASMLGAGANVVVAGHLMLEGLAPGSEVTDFARGRDVFYPVDECRRLLPEAVMVNGHYHAPGTFRGVEMPGTLARLTRGEIDNPPGYLVVEVGS